MKSVYIAGPITAETKEQEQANIKAAEQVAKKYYEMGYAVYCPHTQVIEGADVSYEQWMANDIYWIEKCDVVAFMPDWQRSRGASIEHMVARGLGKEMQYIREANHEQLPAIPTERTAGDVIDACVRAKKELRHVPAVE